MNYIILTLQFNTTHCNLLAWNNKFVIQYSSYHPTKNIWKGHSGQQMDFEDARDHWKTLLNLGYIPNKDRKLSFLDTFEDSGILMMDYLENEFQE